MRIVTWNVNSIRVRLDPLRELLRRHAPDVVCLQETKVPEEEFPADELAAEGYRSLVAGQRGYNGVAILAREELRATSLGFGDDGEDDAQARIARATVGPLRVVNLYVPNGESVGSPKYDYKLAWLRRLRRMLDEQEDPRSNTVLVGDFNVAPEERDVYNPKRWEGKVLFSEPERAAFRKLLEWGLTDCFRRHHRDAQQYTWWDYRFDMFRKRKGLRIDHVLATESLAARSRSCTVDESFRGLDRPSDHAPVLADFDLGGDAPASPS